MKCPKCGSTEFLFYGKLNYCDVGYFENGELHIEVSEEHYRPVEDLYDRIVCKSCDTEIDTVEFFKSTEDVVWE